MSLPTITAPEGLPAFSAYGHAIQEDSVYEPVTFASGHSRQRRLWTVPERIVSVGWVLTTAQLAICDEWYAVTLQKGTLEFAARVANQGAGEVLLWWRARWASYQTELMLGGLGRVTGSLFLTGEGSETGPA